jgi:general secretion pathway protein J
MRAVEGFLRRRLVSAQNIAFATEPSTQRLYRFVGEPQRMRFVADLPNYLGRGGPHLHDLRVTEDGRRLQVAFAVVQSGQTMNGAQPRPPEPLAEDLRAVRFLYRGLDQNGRLTEWQPQWRLAEVLPVQVSIDIETATGERWPPLVVTLAQGSAVASSFNVMEPPP